MTTPTFSAISKEEYFDLLLRRMRGEEPELTWLAQFREILREVVRPGQTLLDAGCATGYAARALSPLKLDYLGIDAEPLYLDAARKWFTGKLPATFIRHNMSDGPVMPPRDVVICCAMLEHCEGLRPILDNLAASCKETLLLRTFMGHEEDLVSIPSPNSAYTQTCQKPVNQYAFKKIFAIMNDCGFDCSIFRDKYTDSMPRYVDGQVRSFYILKAKRQTKIKTT